MIWKRHASRREWINRAVLIIVVSGVLLAVVIADHMGLRNHP